MLIRKATQSDLAFIYESVCDLKHETLAEDTFAQIFYANIANDNYLYLIAEEEATKVGFISFHTQQLLHHVGGVGEIQEFYVLPAYRGKGVGRLLVKKVFEFAQQNQLTSIEVTTNQKRAENIAVYESLGFKLSHHKFTIYDVESLETR